MKRKIIYISITLLLVIGLTLKYNVKEKTYLNKEAIENNKSIAVYIEQDNGTYNKTTAIPKKEDNYILNINKSVCNGNTTIGWDKEEWGIELNNIDREETKCYLYFDIDSAAKKLKELGLTSNTTIPNFSQIATTDEGIFEVEDEMYGGYSYYWRGVVTNNYVKFGGFCWRIIRINGDGSVRLIYDGTICHANGTNTAESIAVASTAYNTSSNQSYYVGWTYSSAQRPSTANPQLGGTASNAKTQLESWYNSNIGNNSTYSSKIADGKYCNDRNVGQPLSSWSGYVTMWSASGTQFAHAGPKRLYEDYAPTLSCSNGDIYSLKVGLITADEVELAGGNNAVNKSYYLYNGQNYWTMSPYQWYSSSHSWAYVFVVATTGSLGNTGAHATSIGLRPVINLKSDIIFSDGNGTLDNPYIVQ